jgi:protein-arginine kinase activator protein McsA
MRRTSKICTFCPGKTPVGRYFLPRKTGHESGWIYVCESCAKTFGQYQHVEYFEHRGTVKSECVHEWRKKSLVTQEGGYDEMICQKCGTITKRHGLGQDFNSSNK